jgi:hypothetical protein
MMLGTRILAPFSFLFIILAFPAVGTTGKDVKGSKDHPLFTRLPNYYIDQYKVSEFDTYDSFVDSGGAYKTVEGRKYYINYYFDEGTKYLSDAQIKGNYREAFIKIGGVIHYEDRYNLHMSLDNTYWRDGVSEYPPSSVIPFDFGVTSRRVGESSKDFYGISAAPR